MRARGATNLGCRPLLSLPAQWGQEQRLPVRGGIEGRCQVLVMLSCFIISWPSMPPSGRATWRRLLASQPPQRGGVV